MNAYDLLVAVNGKGAAITGVDWTDTPTDGHGYAVVDFGGSLAQRSGGDIRFDFSVRCCGFTRDQALLTLDLVRAAFTDWRPLPMSRPDVKAEELDGGPLLPSTSVPGDPRWSSTLLFRIDT